PSSTDEPGPSKRKRDDKVNNGASTSKDEPEQDKEALPKHHVLYEPVEEEDHIGSQEDHIGSQMKSLNRPASASSCASRATTTTEYSRDCPSAARSFPSYSERRVQPSVERARRPLPPRPSGDIMPSKTSVPLKVWLITSASCFAVCAVLVLATVVVTRWGYQPQVYETPEPVYSQPIQHPKALPTTTEVIPTTTESSSEELENDIQFPILEKLSIFKNIVAKRDKKKDFSLLSKPQMHPMHDVALHVERKIEKKDHAKLPEHEVAKDKKVIPDFKPTLPDVFINNQDVKLPDGYVAVLKKNDHDFYEEYYNDENLYDDYMQSNTMTSYLIEKVQELHDWITADPDFEIAGNHSKKKSNNDFGQLLKALNNSLIEGNVNIVMNKLKDIYFGDNYTSGNHSRKIILSNSTDLLSFGILTLDVMILHNIQLMAWENQEGVRNKMLKDPDVFAFNALFLDPSKVESKQNEVYNTAAFSKRQNIRAESVDDFDIGKNLLENVLEIGMSTARAAIHLGRAYKNTNTIAPPILAPMAAIESAVANTSCILHLSLQAAAVVSPAGSSPACVTATSAATVMPDSEPPVPSPAESRASSVSSRSSRTARRAPTPPRPIMLGNKKVAEKEQEKGTESNDFIKAEPSPPRYKPGPKSRQAPREDPKSRTAPKEDPKSRLAPREDPKSRTAPKEDPKSRLALRDPKSLQGAKEDPKSRQAPKEDPKIPVPLKILKSKSKLNVVSTPPKVSQACNPCGKWFVTTEEAATHHRYHRAATFPHISNGLCMPYDLIPDVKCERCWKTFITSTLMDAHRCQGVDGRPGGKTKSRQMLKDDPKSRQAPKEDPKSRLVPKADPKTMV
ncbi:hypothetical protein MSG28_015930, partial [Choristoneura fumiferana]